MPVKKNRPEYEVKFADWLSPIIAELNEAKGSGGAGAPEIVEDYQAFSDKFSVRVIWSMWEGVPAEDRVPIVLEAYNRSNRAADLPKITHARGLTPDEHKVELLADAVGFGSWSKGRVTRIPS